MGANDGNETREAEGVGAIVVEGIMVWLDEGVGAFEFLTDGLLDGLIGILFGLKVGKAVEPIIVGFEVTWFHHGNFDGANDGFDDEANWTDENCDENWNDWTSDGANDGNETREAEGVGAIVVGVLVWLLDGVGADEEEVGEALLVVGTTEGVVGS